jgi:hypothetical protein
MLPKILTINADNVMLNDKQMSHLDKLPNLFKQVNHVRCFNHTLQLSAKALLKTFDNPKPGSIDDNDADDNAQPPDLITFNNNNNGFDLLNRKEDEDDPMAMLPAVDHEALIEDTAAVWATLDKVRHYSFSHSNGSHCVLDPKTFFCSHSIHNHCPACLA